MVKRKWERQRREKGRDRWMGNWEWLMEEK